VVAVHEWEGQLPRLGPNRWLVLQIIDDIGLAQRLGEEGIQQAEGLALDGGFWRPGPGVPEPPSAIPVTGGEPGAVGAEGHARARAGVTAKHEGFLAGRGVPELHRPIGADRGDPRAIRGEREAADWGRIGREWSDPLAGMDVPEFDGPVLGCECKLSA